MWSPRSTEDTTQMLASHMSCKNMLYCSSEHRESGTHGSAQQYFTYRVIQGGFKKWRFVWKIVALNVLAKKLIFQLC